MALTARQQRFVDEYLIDLNATQAAIRAGYSAKRASELGYQLLQKPTVQAEIKHQMAARTVRTKIDQDSVVRERAKIGFSDIRKMFDADGQPIPVHKLGDDIAAAISSVEIDDGRYRLKLWDKNKALDELMKHTASPEPESTELKTSDADFIEAILDAVNAANKLRE